MVIIAQGEKRDCVTLLPGSDRFHETVAACRTAYPGWVIVESVF